jgi:hypothetical protein
VSRPPEPTQQQLVDIEETVIRAALPARAPTLPRSSRRKLLR